MSVPVWTLCRLCLQHVDGIIPKILFGLRSWFFDVRYKPIPRDTFAYYLDIWKRKILPNLHYRYDYWDCDDFAEFFASWMKLMTGTNGVGMSIGVVKTPQGVYRHAWNGALVMKDNIELVFVEPQTGDIVFMNTPLVPSAGVKTLGRTIIANGKDEWKYKLRAVIW